jgi:hypothetical protein
MLPSIQACSEILKPGVKGSGANWNFVPIFVPETEVAGLPPCAQPGGFWRGGSLFVLNFSNQYTSQDIIHICVLFLGCHSC